MSLERPHSAVCSSSSDDTIEQSTLLASNPSPTSIQSRQNEEKPAKSSTSTAESSAKRVKNEHDTGDTAITSQEHVKNEASASPLHTPFTGPNLPSASSTQASAAALQPATITRGPNANVNPKYFGCPVPGCTTTMTRKENLKMHLNTPSESRPFTCKHNGCGKGFNASSGRTRHHKTCKYRPERIEEGAEKSEEQAGDNEKGAEQHEQDADGNKSMKEEV